ncbi:hypothetical protein GF386_05770 [Candidatus Pacearchaeota archaeon]|nr:hypothetical protein [Candidatus Pacearchaeota archaeon]MBD3283601.1 hypothetical protein [Candidatus Pacearchaeota archaeon]
MTKKKSRKKINKIILITIIVLIVILATLLIFQFGIFKYVKNITKEPRLFVIRDECSLILGNILHQIKSNGECKIFCRNNCNLREMNYHNSEFIEKEGSCHICNCYCK